MDFERCPWCVTRFLLRNLTAGVCPNRCDAWKSEFLGDKPKARANEPVAHVYGAREDRQWSASNAAITGIGKALGILSDKLDVNVTHTLKPGLSLEELEDRMGRLKALKAGIIEGEGVLLDDSEIE